MRDGLARATPSYAEGRVLNRLWTDQRHHQQMEYRGSDDSPGALKADHHRPVRTRPEWPGDGEILDRP